MKRLTILILMIAALVTLLGCRHVNSSNPAVIAQANLLNARKTVNTIAHGLLSANDVLKGLATEEPAYYAAVHPKLVRLAQLNDQADNCITQAESGTPCGWQGAVGLIAQSIGDPTTLTTFGFKNPQTQQTVRGAFNDLLAGLRLAAAIGGR